jgi:hypothetical protein
MTATGGDSVPRLAKLTATNSGIPPVDPLGINRAVILLSGGPLWGSCRLSDVIGYACTAIACRPTSRRV